MHRNTPIGKWFHIRNFPENLNKASKAKKKDDEGIDEDEDRQLESEDYDVFMNPQLIAETADKEYAWEYSPSFPGIRAMVKRPLAIKISYLNLEGDEVESEMFSFQARQFLHSLDQINGRMMTHWRLSEGNIDIIEGQRDHYKHLQSTIDFYKHKIEEVKANFGDGLFTQDLRKHSVSTDPTSGKACKFEVVYNCCCLQGRFSRVRDATWGQRA